ncbi:hypothetical protein [Sandaracinobacteroides hominis]|uniref:hypothetical protein n=1 Tax=Sandaracinobacteroides hominis TaxID=2780086 RepID=UPI0018F78257|nr:hypothetical protein [Sandaracinobacteroides hominis]
MNTSFDYSHLLHSQELRLSGWLKYLGPSRLGPSRLGPSRLGIGPLLGDSQGDYLDTGVAARLGNERRGVTFTLTNLFDSQGNRFALGTPFETATRRFITPQRPGTLRIAVDASF